MKKSLFAAVLAVFLFTLWGCGSEKASTPTSQPMENIANESTALSAAPAALMDILTTEHPGTKTAKNNVAEIDYSNLSDGYVMMCYTASADKRLKAQVKGPATTYSYNLTPGEWAAFPLSDGNGSYSFLVYENVEGTRYAAVLTQDCAVVLQDEFAPFLRPNQYVNYAGAVLTMEKASELTAGVEDPLEKVAAVYDWVIGNIKYDKKLAETVQSGYLPELDAVMRSKKGICFDYAALMTGMLRSCSVPCKLVVGYVGEAYHAWIDVWVDGIGWVKNAVYFNGTNWERMDPTFAATGGSTQSINRYIGDGTNYAAKYFY